MYMYIYIWTGGISPTVGPASRSYGKGAAWISYFNSRCPFPSGQQLGNGSIVKISYSLLQVMIYVGNDCLIHTQLIFEWSLLQVLYYIGPLFPHSVGLLWEVEVCLSYYA
jgi:hypothetical protein